MDKETRSSKIVKWFLISISVIFVVLMLLLPLITVITEAFKQGFAVYEKAVTDNYTVNAGSHGAGGDYQYGFRAECRLVADQVPF